MRSKTGGVLGDNDFSALLYYRFKDLVELKLFVTLACYAHVIFRQLCLALSDEDHLSVKFRLVKIIVPLGLHLCK